MRVLIEPLNHGGPTALRCGLALDRAPRILKPKRSVFVLLNLEQKWLSKRTFAALEVLEHYVSPLLRLDREGAVRDVDELAAAPELVQHIV